MERTILVVDDDPGTVENLADLLESNGYEVWRAYDGRSAFHQLIGNTDNEPCAILLDLNMPIVDGWQFMALIRSYVRLSKIPTILITGQRVPPHAVAIFEEILLKPLDLDKLFQSVERACAQGRAPI